MANYDQVVTRWVDRVSGWTDKPFLRNERMPVIGEVIHSYGSHFPLAVPIRDRRGGLIGFVLNGDRYSNTTAKHQSHIRGAVHRRIHDTSLWSVILPFSALEMAGIDIGSIRVLDVTEDWIERREVVVHERPSGSVWDYYTDTVPGTGGYLADDGSFYPYREAWNLSYAQRQALTEVPTVTKNTGRKTLRTRRNSHHEWELFDDDGQLAYRREVTRHWLGESLIQADVLYNKTIKCRTCKGTGRHDGDTRWEYAKVQGPVEENRAFPLWERVELPSCDGCGGGGKLRVTRRRTAKFLSGFDQNETRPSYFFCELPKMSEASVTAAYDALKPTTVLLAEQMGREVKRQGDIFAVPIPNVTTRDLTKAGGKRERSLPIWNTNHVVTEQIVMPSGTVFARGTLRHAPQWRRPDHKRVTIGGDWHIIVKNTVPTAA